MSIIFLLIRNIFANVKSVNLTQYLRLTGEKPYKFADRAGVSRSLVYDLLKREAGHHTRQVKLDNARKIVTASGGRISLEEMAA